jgi:hydrogenase maturation protease
MARTREEILVVGIGNPGRGDDAAGRIAAARLRARATTGLRIAESDGEATALIALMDEADEVVLIDALVSDGEPGTIARIDVGTSSLPTGRFGLSSHGFGLAEAIELARALGQLPRRCVIYAIEGRSFDHGDPLSGEVDAAVDEVVAQILKSVSVKAH